MLGNLVRFMVRLPLKLLAYRPSLILLSSLKYFRFWLFFLYFKIRCEKQMTLASLHCYNIWTKANQHCDTIKQKVNIYSCCNHMKALSPFIKDLNKILVRDVLPFSSNKKKQVWHNIIYKKITKNNQNIIRSKIWGSITVARTGWTTQGI